MTPVELECMTLGDLEAMASRLDAAARTIRDAMALMRGTTEAAPVPVVTRDPAAPIQTNKGPVTLSAAERAERQRLLRQNLPADIAEAEEAT